VAAGADMATDVAPGNVVGGIPAHLIKSGNAPLKLHLGCGRRCIAGFIHIDVQPAPHVNVVSVVERLPMRDASVSVIYASHVLEHFGRHEYRAVLAEWFRVLEPAGTLRLAVPDFAACAAVYWGGSGDALSEVLGLIMGGQRNSYDYHKMIFDEDHLRSDLLGVGFREVRRWDWRTTEHSGVDDYSQAYLPHLHKEDGRLMSLNLEARK
jgi:predicted SAM-dependent methyltransferase